MRRISQCLNTRLVDICQRTMQLEELNLKLSHYLPLSLKNHCHAGSFSKGCLTIVANDAAWGSQLRYALPELRDDLRAKAGFYQLSSIKISIMTNDTHLFKKRAIKKAPHLSQKARHTIQSIGKQCHYLPLKNALLQLADIKDSEQ
jgi:hypothetical protein